MTVEAEELPAGPDGIAMPAAETAAATEQARFGGQGPHLLFFVGGMSGNPEPFNKVAGGPLATIWGDRVSVHVCTETFQKPGSSTYDGVDVGGARLAEEVREHVSRLLRNAADGSGPPPRTISFWGHSLGGLYIRYALPELAGPDDGTLCGLEPLFFFTTASPHLGIAATFPTLLAGAATSFGVCGRTGEQLFLADEEVLVSRLGTEERYLAPLRAFRYRALLANLCDQVVDFCTAALQPWVAPGLWEAPALAPDFPSVVHDSATWDRPLRPVRRRSSRASATSALVPSTGSLSLQDLVRSQCCCSTRGKPGLSPYYVGHESGRLIEQAQERLASLSWRLICVRFPGESMLPSEAHNRVCYGAELDTVLYVCTVVMKDPFGQ